MTVKWNELWSVHTISLMCLVIVIIIIYSLQYYIRNFKLRKRFHSSLAPGFQGSHLRQYISLLFWIYKQSTPACTGLALLLQCTCFLCILYGKQGLMRTAFLFRQLVVFYKPDSVEVLMRDPELIGKGSVYNLLVPWLGDGLVTSEKTTWRKHRKLLTPTLHFSILENFIPVFQEQSEILVSKLDLHVKEPWIDALPLLSSCTLDIICKTAMGISINAQNEGNTELTKAIHDIENIFMYRFIRPWLYSDYIFNLTSRGRKLKSNIQLVHGFSEKVIKEKKIEMNSISSLQSKAENETEGIYFRKRKPLLELLLEYHLKDPTFTEKDVRDEVNTFIFAGHDTSAVTVNWILYCLGVYQEIQQKVYEELEDIFVTGDNNFTWETIKKMKYLERVIKETMRLYPTAPAVIRENSKAFQVQGYDVPSGTTCVLFFYGLHRDPESFPDPEVFDPDRFLPKNSKDRHPYAYVPFSAGPRNCIGQKFAMMEMKTILTNILRRFRVTSLDNRDKVILYLNIVGMSVRPLRLRFDPR